jgi:hypothetical protein
MPIMATMEPTLQLIFSALHSVTVCVFLISFFPEIKWHRADKKRLAAFAVGVTASLVSSSVPRFLAKITVLADPRVPFYFLKAACTFVHLLLSVRSMVDSLSFVGQIPFFSMIGSSRSSILASFGS